MSECEHCFIFDSDLDRTVCELCGSLGEAEFKAETYGGQQDHIEQPKQSYFTHKTSWQQYESTKRQRAHCDRISGICGLLKLPQTVIVCAQTYWRQQRNIENTPTTDILLGACVYAASRTEQQAVTLREVAIAVGCSWSLLGRRYKVLKARLNLKAVLVSPIALVDRTVAALFPDASSTHILARAHARRLVVFANQCGIDQGRRAETVCATCLCLAFEGNSLPLDLTLLAKEVLVCLRSIQALRIEIETRLKLVATFIWWNDDNNDRKLLLCHFPLIMDQLDVLTKAQTVNSRSSARTTAPDSNPDIAPSISSPIPVTSSSAPISSSPLSLHAPTIDDVPAAMAATHLPLLSSISAQARIPSPINEHANTVPLVIPTTAFSPTIPTSTHTTVSLAPLVPVNTSNSVSDSSQVIGRPPACTSERKVSPLEIVAQADRYCSNWEKRVKSARWPKKRQRDFFEQYYYNLFSNVGMLSEDNPIDSANEPKSESVKRPRNRWDRASRKSLCSKILQNWSSNGKSKGNSDGNDTGSCNRSRENDSSSSSNSNSRSSSGSSNGGDSSTNNSMRSTYYDPAKPEGVAEYLLQKGVAVEKIISGFCTHIQCQGRFVCSDISVQLLASGDLPKHLQAFAPLLPKGARVSALPCAWMQLDAPLSDQDVSPAELATYVRDKNVLLQWDQLQSKKVIHSAVFNEKQPQTASRCEGDDSEEELKEAFSYISRTFESAETEERTEVERETEEQKEHKQVEENANDYEEGDYYEDDEKEDYYEEDDEEGEDEDDGPQPHAHDDG